MQEISGNNVEAPFRMCGHQRVRFVLPVRTVALALAATATSLATTALATALALALELNRADEAAVSDMCHRSLVYPARGIDEYSVSDKLRVINSPHHTQC